MRKKPEITEQTRKNLVSAFWTLYMDKPVSRITVAEITDLAGYTRATFYRYYTDVYQLLEEEENRLLNQIKELFESAAKTTDEVSLLSQAGAMLVILRQNNLYASALLSDHGDPAFVSRLKDLLWPYISHYLLQLDGGGTYEAELLKEYYLSGIFGTVRKWLQDPQIEIDRLIQILAAMVTGSR